MDLKQLAIDHPYYCHSTNYTNNDARMDFDTMSDFLEEFGDADVDMNLVFRFDVIEKTDEDDEPLGLFKAEVFIMQQRKGNFVPCVIKSIMGDEVGPFVLYLEKHHQRLMEMWAPLPRHFSRDSTSRPMQGLT